MRSWKWTRLAFLEDLASFICVYVCVQAACKCFLATAVWRSYFMPVQRWRRPPPPTRFSSSYAKTLSIANRCGLVSHHLQLPGILIVPNDPPTSTQVFDHSAENCCGRAPPHSHVWAVCVCQGLRGSDVWVACGALFVRRSAVICHFFPQFEYMKVIFLVDAEPRNESINSGTCNALWLFPSHAFKPQSVQAWYRRF